MASVIEKFERLLLPLKEHQIIYIQTVGLLLKGVTFVEAIFSNLKFEYFWRNEDVYKRLQYSAGPFSDKFIVRLKKITVNHWQKIVTINIYTLILKIISCFKSFRALSLMLDAYPKRG
jgi:hypothetical protein